MQTLSRRCLHFNQFHCIFDDDSNHCEIHLQSAVSVLLSSKPVLTLLAARRIIKMLFSCSLVVSYSSESIEPRTISAVVSDFIFYLEEHRLIRMGIVHRQWFLRSLGYKSQFTPDAKASSTPHIYRGWVLDTRLLQSFPKTIRFLEWLCLVSLFLGLSGLNQQSPNMTCCASYLRSLRSRLVTAAKAVGWLRNGFKAQKSSNTFKA